MIQIKQINTEDTHGAQEDLWDTGTGQRIVLNVIDGVGLVHALLLRIQALLLPIKTLVLSGH